MANITRTSAGPFIPQIWANTALEILRNRVVLAKLVTRDSDIAAFQVGDTLNIPYPGAFTANDKAANTAVTLQVPTATTTTVTLNKHKEASFLVEDAARATANQDIIARYMEAAIVPIAEQIESDLLGLYSGFSNSVGTSGTDITASTIRAARKKLNDLKAPVDNRALVVSTKDEIAILGDSTLQSFFAFAQSGTVKEGSIGRLYGFDVYASQLVPVVTGTPNSTKNLAFNPGAIILAMRGLPDAPAGTGAQTSVVQDPVSGLSLRVTMAYNASNLGVQVTVDVLYGVAKLRDEKAVVVLS
jgi:hypothetical protein